MFMVFQKGEKNPRWRPRDTLGNLSGRHCSICGSTKTWSKNLPNGLVGYSWYVYGDGHICEQCYRFTRKKVVHQIPHGREHGSWKGGRIMKDDYVYILNEDRISSPKWRYRPEHRVIYEKHHKCCLLPWGCVHHINGIKNDNRIENLEGIMWGSHTRLHRNGKPFKDTSNRSCIICHSQKTETRQSNTSDLVISNWYHFEDGYVCRVCYQRMRKEEKQIIRRI